MADIRINALATTAASTASDDFVAVDGSANGTRKLNAYSPTFGGNLTVSGTALLGTSDANSGAYFDYNTGIGGASALWMKQTTKSAATATLVGGGTYTVLNAASGGSVLIRIANADGITLDSSRNTTIAGNLTVSGTQMQMGGVNPFIQGTTGAGYIQFQNAGDVVVASNTGKLVLIANGSTRATVATTGNFLLATTTDSANGKLQLATHTTSAGGIGFGTDTALYRTAAGRLLLQQIGGTSPLFGLSENGTTTAEFQSASGDVYLTANTAGKSLILRTVGTTALTLDSSQNATFAGKVTISSTTASSSTTTGALVVSGGVGVGGKMYVGDELHSQWTLFMDRAAQADIKVSTASAPFNIKNSADTNVLNIDTATGNGTFAGWIAIKDGSTAPSATSGTAKIYVDTADGDLKVIFGDGTVKTIVVDS
jgi:hypothetical protein